MMLMNSTSRGSSAMPTHMVETLPFSFTSGEESVLRARPRVSTFDWARKNVRLVSGPFKGQLWNPDVSPFARPIMDAFDRPHVRKIFLIQPSQTTKSTIALICFLSALLRMRDNFGIGMPDQEAVRKYFTGRMASYFSNIPELRAQLRGRDALNNFFINLEGGAAVLGMWAGSDSTMRAESMPLVLVEEEDAFPDPGAAAVMEERTSAYDNMQLSKIMRVCRPKGSEDSSSIWNAAKTQAEAWCVYEARCPLCQEYTRMEHADIVSDNGSHDPGEIRQKKLGRYRCPHCRNTWSDQMRNMALRAGRMASLTGDMEEATILAYHIRQWESPLVSLSDVLAKWFEAQNNPRALQLWDNNICAKPYKFVQLETDHSLLARHIRQDLAPGVAPGWTVALTFAADMQMDHFFWSVAAHGLSPSRLHIVDYGRVDRFDELEQLLFAARYGTEDGRMLGIWRGALDTGGTRHFRDEDSRTLQAYKWLRGLRPGVMFGTKGMSRETPGVLVKVSTTEVDAKGRRLADGQRLHLLHSDAFKRSIYWRLAEGAEEEPITFHAGTTEEYLKQIASERLEKDRNGREVWKAVRANHFLDCLVGHAALENWQWAPSLAALAGHDGN